MWLYIPSNCAPESACSERESVPHSSFSASSTEPFATWSGKPLQPRSLPVLWKREPLIRRLSGLTCSPSTAQRGADSWISSLRASRARTSASPGGAPDLMVRALAFSSTSSTSLTIAVRSDSFWRTSAPSLLPPPPLWTKPKALSKNAPPPVSWENWPTAGGTRNGSLFQRQMWAPVMGAPDGSASLGGVWPTPDTGHERINRSTSEGATSRPTIALAAKLWMTPNVPNGGRCLPPELIESRGKTSSGEKRTVDLGSQSRNWTIPIAPDSRQLMNMDESGGLWPTPNAHDGRRPGADLASTQGGNLSRDAALWPTPASRDYRTPNSQESQESRKHTGGEQLPNFVEHHFSHPVLSTLDGRALSPTDRTLPRRLNPAFACWLMGWPIWWTNPALTSCVRSEMELYRCRLQWHLSSCFAEPGGASEPR